MLQAPPPRLRPARRRDSGSGPGHRGRRGWAGAPRRRCPERAQLPAPPLPLGLAAAAAVAARTTSPKAR